MSLEVYQLARQKKKKNILYNLVTLKLFGRDLYRVEDVTTLGYNPKKLGDIFHHVYSCSAIKI